MNRMTKLAGVALSAATLTAACGSSDGNSGDSSAGKTFTVGFANEKPYSYSAASGKVEGLDPSLLRACASAIGAKDFKFVQVDFGGLVPGLQSRRFDVINGGVLYKEERQKVADATSPTYSFRTAAMVEKGNPLNLNNLDDLKAVKGNVGGTQGTIEYQTVADDPAMKGRTKGYETGQSAYSDLENGRLIAVIDNEALIRNYIAENPSVDVDVAAPFEGVVPESGSVLFFRKGLEKTVDKMSACLDGLKKNGELAEILKANDYPAESVTPVGATTPNR